jgi:serine/threonine protein kinase/putative intracellular protease/amidase
MSMEITHHPEPHLLHQFALGELDDAPLQSVAEHVEHCNQCMSVVSQVPNDPLVQKLGSIGSEFELNLNSEAGIPAALLEHPRYEVIRELGRGGMGAVYLARHKVMNRLVALKLIRPDLTRNQKIVERFMKEVHVSAQQSHPNIVTAFDAQRDADSLFLVMEYVEGINLHDWIRKNGPLSIRQACHFALQIAQGLEHARRRALVHRDIKPKNLIVARNGRIKILDFGLATLHDTEKANETRELTQTGVVMGSPDFISPEQASDAKKADSRSDIYSLGCTLYFMLSGRVPFEYNSVAEKIGAHLHVPPPDPRTVRPDIPDDLAQYTLQMMAKSVDQRPQSYVEIMNFLRNYAKQSSDKPASSQHEALPVGPYAADDTISQSVGESIVQIPVHAQPKAPPAANASPVTGPYGLQIATAPAKPGQKSLARPIMLVSAAILIAIFAICYTIYLGAGENLDNSTGPVAPPLNAKVLVVVPFDNYWPPDFDGVVDVLQRNQTPYEIASTQMGPARPSNLRQTRHLANATRILDGNEANEFDAVIFIGTYPVADMTYMRDKLSYRQARKLINDMIDQQKIVAGVCGGVAPICDADVLGNRRIAHSIYLDPRINNDPSFNWVKDKRHPVVVDEGQGTIISGQLDSTASEVTRQVLLKLESTRPGG